MTLNNWEMITETRSYIFQLNDILAVVEVVFG